MAFLDRLKGKGGKQKLAPPGESTNKVVKVPLMDRLTELQEAGTDWTIKLNKRDGQPGAVKKQYQVMDIEPVSFDIEVGEDIGGGSYDVTFADGGTTVMLPGTDIPEKHVLKIHGESKRKSEGKGSELGLLEKALAAKSDTIGGALLQAVIAYFAAKVGNSSDGYDKAIDAVVKLRSLVPDVEIPNPVEFGKSLFELLKMANDATRPPPVNTQGGGFWSALATQLAPTITNALAGQQQQQIPQQAGQPGFAGTGQIQGQQGTPPQGQQAQQPQQSKVIEMPQQPQPQKQDEQAINPFAKLQAMWIDRNVSDEDLAVFAVEVIDSYVKFQMGGEIPLQYRNLLEDPGAALDILLSLLPQVEFRDKQRLKEHGIKFIEQWKARSQEVQEGMEDVSVEQVQDTGDGGTGSFEDDQSQDQERQEHGRPGEIHSPEHSQIPD